MTSLMKTNAETGADTSSYSYMEGLYKSGKLSVQQLEIMQKERRSQSGNDLSREPFTTIDDLTEKAEELVTGLRKLSEYKHPLDVRRGVKAREEVSDISVGDESKTVKAGSKTYFLDLKKTKEDKPFLVITESRFKAEGKDRERTSIVVFPDHAKEFGQAVSEMIKKLG